MNHEAEHGVMDLCKIKVLFVFVFIILLCIHSKLLIKKKVNAGVD